MIVCMTSTYSGIFSGTGMLDGITEYVKTISQKTGRFLCIVLLSVVTSMVGCNQTIAIMMTEQLGCVLYKEQENSQRAVDLEDSARFDFGTYSVVHCGSRAGSYDWCTGILSCSSMLSVFNSDLSIG